MNYSQSSGKRGLSVGGKGYPLYQYEELFIEYTLPSTLVLATCNCSGHWDLTEVKVGFYRIAFFQHSIGAIDGTLITFLKTFGRWRKCYHAIYVQAHTSAMKDSFLSLEINQVGGLGFCPTQRFWYVSPFW